MNKVRLGDVAEVILSNIDKKSVDGQAKVRLCNFTDVYYNWAITQEMYESFMKATATNSQIDSLSISKGMVAITKDSETKYDIGISVYIADDFDDVVLGYHCVLIKPNKDLLSGKYLNVILHSSYAQKYFENHASGSGQRYTLSKEAIEDMKIPYVAPEDQNKIGNFFSEIDRKIEINKQINDNLQQQLRLIFEYEFLGKNYAKQPLSDLTNMYQPQTISAKELDNSGSYYVYGANGIIGKYNRFNHLNSEITVACRGTCGNTLMTLPYSWITGNAMVVQPKELFPYKEYLFYHLQKISIAYLTSGSVQPQLTRENMGIYEVIIPPKNRIEDFEIKAATYRRVITNNISENNKLAELRDWLLPMLMNGQATIE